MIILVDPVLDCAFDCSYCYNKDLHTDKNEDFKLSEEQMQTMIDNIYKYTEKYPGTTVSFHGGEPTLLNDEQFERLLSTINDALGEEKLPSVQTNGYHLTEEKMDILSDYNMVFSYSYDGPWPLSRNRGSGSLEQRKQQAKKVRENLEMLANKDGVQVNVISVINNAHAEVENSAELMIDWFKKAEDMGIHNIKLNVVNLREGKIKNPHKMIEFFKPIIEHNYDNTNNVRIKPASSIADMLLGKTPGSCSYNQCNPINTSEGAAAVITPDGVKDCMRSGEDKDTDADYSQSRSRVLLNKPYEDGGCMVDGKPCRYWLICGGLCPGFTIDGTYWTRNGACKVYKEGLFPYIEKKLKDMIGEGLSTAADFVEEGMASYERLLKVGNTVPPGYVFEDVYDVKCKSVPKKAVDSCSTEKITGQATECGPKTNSKNTGEKKKFTTSWEETSDNNAEAD